MKKLLGRQNRKIASLTPLGTHSLPSTLVPNFAKALGVSIENLLGIGDGPQRAKRGPKSQLERQLEAVATLPRNQQKKILAVVEAMIAHHDAR